MASKEGDQRRLNVYLTRTDPVEGLLLELWDDRTRKQDFLRRLLKAGVADLLDAHSLDPGTLGLDPADVERLHEVRQRAEMDRIDAGARAPAPASASASRENTLPDELPRERPASQPRPPVPQDARAEPDQEDKPEKPGLTVEESVIGILGH
jgi:hypothetical protein